MTTPRDQKIIEIATKCTKSACRFGLNYCDDCAKMYCSKCGPDIFPIELRKAICKDCKSGDSITESEETLEIQAKINKICPHCTREEKLEDKEYCRICEQLYCKRCGPTWMNRSMLTDVVCKICRECTFHNKEECIACTELRVKLSGLNPYVYIIPMNINPKYEISLLYEYSVTSEEGEVIKYNEERTTGIPNFVDDDDIENGQFVNKRYLWYYYINDRRLVNTRISFL